MVKETCRRVRPLRVNKWPKCMLTSWWWWWWWWWPTCFGTGVPSSGSY